MSGICGLFNLDASPVTDPELRAMASMLAKRGPDRTGLWSNGPVGFGHTLLATTPESQLEQQPVRHADTGCMITADVRLDNRDELLRALQLGARRNSIGDAELILAAYLAWGEQCLDRLLGDFAFAIWDSRHQRVFCARDHFGLRPLYYHHALDQCFVFASDARAVLVLQQIPYQIDEGRVADFLVPQLEWIDYTSTFYEGVYRLPPGHKMSVTPARLEIEPYWKLEPGPDLGPLSDAEYAEGFLEVLTQAVNSRLRAPEGTVGSMLSGGMDSGSVVAIGKDILDSRGAGPLPTYSGVRYRDSDCAESRAIYAAHSMPSISPVLVHPDAQQDRYESLVSNIEEPFDSQFTILKAIYLSAHEQGQTVVLDGAAGDVILSEGSYIVRLIRQGQLKLAMREIAGETKFWGGPSLASDMLRYARAAAVPELIKRTVRPARNHLRAKSYLKESLISQGFAARVDIPGRLEKMRQMFPGTWTENYAAERCNTVLPNMTGGRERYGRLAAGAATEARDPFLDKRVVEYCSQLPGKVRMRDGWPKIILRELMEDRLPDEVRWAREKPHLGWFFNECLTKQAIASGKLEIERLQEDLASYVDPVALRSAWARLREGKGCDAIYTAFVLSLWLRETVKRPVVQD